MPAPAAPQIADLADIAGLISEIELTLRWAGHGLAEAHIEGALAERLATRVVTLGTLRKAHDDLASVIAELAALRVA